MSPLLHDELRVVLYPDHAVLVHLGAELSLRGIRRPVRGKEIVSPGEAVDGDALWDGALKGVGAALPAHAARKPDATVILSNHFVHYVLVPWSASLSDEGEEAAFARHCFKSGFGDAAEQWEVRLSPGKPGTARVASGVDMRLLQALRAVFDKAGISLKSIQPHLMAAYNACRPSLRGRNAWFVACEQGNLCFALLQHGQWGAVKTVRIDNDWRKDLPLILEREACLVEAKMDTDEVLLWAPEEHAVELPRIGRWKFKHLRLPTRHDIVPDHDARYSMALGIESL